jgi:hypothetical protein
MLFLRRCLLVCSTMLVIACGEDEAALPILTHEAFSKAARDCNAVGEVFIFRTKNRLPSIRFTVTSSDETSGKTAQCMADALAGYGYDSMEIRLARPA